MKEDNYNKLSYEEAYSRLEEIVRKLESGELGLDESLNLFEDGIKLSKVCNKRLSEAEARIEKLVKEENGRITREEFTVEESGDEEDDAEDGLPF